MRTKLNILLFAVFLLTSCVKEREMRCDEGLLGNEVVNTDLMIAYKTPAGYKMLSQSFTDSVAAQELAANPFSERRVTIYLDTLIGNATMCLYDMRQIPYEKTEDRLDFYFSAYNPDGTWEKIEKNIFRHGDFKKIVELDMVNTQTNRRLLKYYFYENDKAQFSVDYFMRNDYHNDLQPFIESSVASFKKNYDIVIDVLN